jgi:hypothetical protein
MNPIDDENSINQATHAPPSRESKSMIDRLREAGMARMIRASTIGKKEPIKYNEMAELS